MGANHNINITVNAKTVRSGGRGSGGMNNGSGVGGAGPMRTFKNKSWYS